MVKLETKYKFEEVNKESLSTLSGPKGSSRGNLIPVLTSSSKFHVNTKRTEPSYPIVVINERS